MAALRPYVVPQDGVGAAAALVRQKSRHASALRMTAIARRPSRGSGQRFRSQRLSWVQRNEKETKASAELVSWVLSGALLR
eukprot:1606538-Rhodomonas_salina.1